MRHIEVQFALLVGALVLATQASAQVYRCTDVSGKVFYSQFACPADTKSKVISREAPMTEDSSSAKRDAKKGGSNPELEFRKRQKEREEADKKALEQAAQAKRQQEDCQRARGVLGQYESGMRIANVDEKGERYYLDESQIEQEKTRLRGLVAQLCK